MADRKPLVINNSGEIEEISSLDKLTFISPQCEITHSSSQAIVTATDTVLAFDTETEDNDAMHDNVTNNSRITIKTAGRYQIILLLTFASNATGFRIGNIRLNGTTVIGSNVVPAVNGNATRVVVTRSRRFAVNDYIEALAHQTSGGNLNVNSQSEFTPRFSAVWESA